MRRFPSYISNPIDRGDVVHDYIKGVEEQEKAHKEAHEKEQLAQHQTTLSEIRNDMGAFKAMAPKNYERFIQNIVQFHGLCYELDRHSPLDNIRSQKKDGVYMDAQQWAIYKAYVQGQTDLLNAFTKTISIDVEAEVQKRNFDLLKKVEKKHNKVLTVFLNLLKKWQLLR